jgi:two-component system, OmpR family, sensor histidine kinase KdpD
VSGSGIGLWIAQAFVQANGGALEAASRGEGQGTKMTLRLPAQEVLHAVAE